MASARCAEAIGFIVPAQLRQGVAEIVVGLGVAGVDFDGATIGGDRFLEMPGVRERQAEIVVGLGVIGFQFDRPAIARHGVVQPAECEVNRAEIAMRFGVVGIVGHRSAHPLHRKVIVTGLMGEHSEIVQRAGMIGLDGKDLPVERFRLRQPAGLVMLEGEGDGLRNGHHDAGPFLDHSRHIVR